MKIICNTQFRVTELLGKIFEIDSNAVHHYTDTNNFKVEYKIVISRFTKDNDGEVIKETGWYVVGKSRRYLSCLGVTFVYDEPSDKIYIDGQIAKI